MRNANKSLYEKARLTASFMVSMTRNFAFSLIKVGDYDIADAHQHRERAMRSPA